MPLCENNRVIICMGNNALCIRTIGVVCMENNTLCVSTIGYGMHGKQCPLCDQ